MKQYKVPADQALESSNINRTNHRDNGGEIPSQTTQHTLPRHLRLPKQNITNMNQIPTENYHYDINMVHQTSFNFEKQAQLGGKDLIIRMLAEIFHVSYNNDGQVRWQQVSTSLVPISLYSRTTSKWLDYLLSNSSSAAASDPSSAMSPDSREFLLLMQQYHQSQQQAPTLSNAGNNFAQRHNRYHQKYANSVRNTETHQTHGECIVFQVVGHDFVEGQCKRILNVKIIQPGTRLGRASDYFVYWKEQPNHITCNQSGISHSQFQQQFSSSFASSTSLVPPQQSHQPSASRSRRCLPYSSSSDSHTWGLNFASVNDARLFYDICSLNLVDLDFNSEYLKQLAFSENQRQDYNAANLRAPTINRAIMSPIFNTSQYRRQQGELHSKANQQTLFSYRSGGQRQRQASNISAVEKCQTCNNSMVALSRISCNRPGTNVLEETQRSNIFSSGCPVHGKFDSHRKRSRSTAKAQTTPKGTKFLHRTRSFSTPASPDADCPIHRKRNDTDEHDYRRSKLKPEAVKENQDKRFVSLMLQQGENLQAPTKPTRGLLRIDPLVDLNRTQFLSRRHDIMNTSHSMQSVDRSSRARQIGLCSLEQTEQNFCPRQETSTKRMKGDGSDSTNLKHKHDLESRNFTNDRVLARDRSNCNRFASKEESRTNQYDKMTRRGARLARARYANSRNMKEFLSLDAGGLQPSFNRQGHDWGQRQQFGQQSPQSSGKALEKLTTHKSHLGDSKPKFSTPAQSAQTRAASDFCDVKAGKGMSSPTSEKVIGTLPYNNNLDYANIKKNVREISEDQVALVTTESMKNVSTTTADLPMDLRTRKRMFNLASEEAISENTEPKAISSMSFCKESEGQLVQHLVERVRPNEERQIRAISLGPEIGRTSKRGRETRSDAGRRRSLERSMCVDLDPVIPSAGVKFARPSPLPQSASSAILEKSRDVDYVGENYEAKTDHQSSHNVQSLASDAPRIELNDFAGKRQNTTPVERQKHNGIPPRDVLSDDFEWISQNDAQYEQNISKECQDDKLSLSQNYNSAVFTRHLVDSHENLPTRAKSARKHYCALADCCINERHPGAERMTTFKSAPDIYRLAENDTSNLIGMHPVNNPQMTCRELQSDHDSFHYNRDDVCYNFEDENLFQDSMRFEYEPREDICNRTLHQQESAGYGRLPTAQAVSKRMSTMSSYAVPLCSSTRRTKAIQDSPRRQCHSCPNSLRRKKRLVGYNNDEWNDLNHNNDNVRDITIRNAIASDLDASCLCQCYSRALSCGSNTKQDYFLKTVHTGARTYCPNDPQTALSAKHSARCSFSHQHQIAEDSPRGLFSTPTESKNYGLSCKFGHGSKLSGRQLVPSKCLDCHSTSERAAVHGGRFYDGENSQHLVHFCRHNRNAVSSQPYHQLCRNVEHSATPHNLTGGASLSRAGTRPLSHSNSFTHARQLSDLASQNHSFGHSPHRTPQRPYTSLSTRSPLHFGLYESEYEEEDELDKIEITKSAQLASRPCSENSKAGFKPFQGYDQTLARTSLKSRQRSRSQPPAGDKDSATADENKNTAHLAKSMENVEKLIREVQSELRYLKRNPLGFARIDMRGATSSGVVEDEPTNKDLQNESKSGLQSHAEFDRCLEAVSGLRCYGYFHRLQAGGSGNITVARCEIDFLSKTSLAEHKESIKCDHSRSDLGASCSDPYRTKVFTTSATRRAGQFKCIGAIRKAGFLSVKKWIIKRRQSIELARRQGWKRYWVCLRGTSLLFHSVIDNKQSGITTREEKSKDDGQIIDLHSWIQINYPNQVDMMSNFLQYSPEQISRDLNYPVLSQCYIERDPKHLIIIDGAIAQPIPEHPRRDFVFCLSTTFGDAYFFQAGCQLESDNWISAIHNACAASIARDLTRDETVKLFGNKIRHLELEAEKKLFLRQRLESRLTSMISMSGCDLNQTYSTNITEESGAVNSSNNPQKVTMRSLLNQLSQQLIALDTYIEQVHCEVYQLKCYLSSCGAQNIFYQNSQLHGSTTSKRGTAQVAISSDLPHPKSLLMHVSKPTKLLLLKLGVFTVSSFHAYIHACHGSAEAILQKVQQDSKRDEEQPHSSEPRTLELRIRSRSISEALLSRPENRKLESETEELIELTNLKTIRLQLTKDLFNAIRGLRADRTSEEYFDEIEADTSDDRYSIRDGGNIVIINLKSNPKTSGNSMIKQILTIINPNSNELDFLEYYLTLVSVQGGHSDESALSLDCRTLKRKESIEQWDEFGYVELREKLVYRIDLSRSQMEESTLPFGISIEGQLFSSQFDSLLDVYCSYIEWGSNAEKSGLQEDDELLMINGIAVADLDLMFVECLLQDATELSLVVRSTRTEYPNNAKKLDKGTWQPSRGDDDSDEKKDADGNTSRPLDRQDLGGGSGEDQYNPANGCGSHIISDEYLTSLVCPPPPARSCAFLSTDQSLVRQNSDLGTVTEINVGERDEFGQIALENTIRVSGASLPKSRSQHMLDDSDPLAQRTSSSPVNASSIKDDCDLAKQLLSSTEKLTSRMNQNIVAPTLSDESHCIPLKVPNEEVSDGSNCDKIGNNGKERLRKSVLELLETEYAYIRQLETINEHYMTPLKQANFLNIRDLKTFNEAFDDVLKLQRDFFQMLTTEVAFSCECVDVKDDFERLNYIVQRFDNHEVSDSKMSSILNAIVKTFQSEGEKFRIYASYCINYSKLQKILHQKCMGNSNLPSPPITSMPSALNTFSNSIVPSLGNLTAQQRDHHFSMRSGNILMPTPNSISSINSSFYSGPSEVQLRQLTEFLSNLDSSSSSISLSSLAKSSSIAPTDRAEHINKSLSIVTKDPQSRIDQNESSNSNSLESENVQSTNDSSRKKNVHQQNFESYLIKPIQRIVKYPMLLNSIVSSVLSSDSKFKIDEDMILRFQTSIKQIESVINHVNDAQKVHDEFGIVLEQIERQYILISKSDQRPDQMIAPRAGFNSENLTALSSGAHQPPIDVDIKHLLYFGPVDWLNINEFTSKIKKPNPNLNQMLFVFKSCVIFVCKEQVRSNKKSRLPSMRISESGSSHNQQQQFGIANNLSQLTSINFASRLFSQKANDTRIIRYQTLIPVREVQVRSVPSDSRSIARVKSTFDASNQNTSSFTWELFQCSSSNSNSTLLTSTNKATTIKTNSKRNLINNFNNDGRVFQLACKTNDERNAFLRKIRFIIRESVRNMSLPLARSPSSRSYTFKKLSSPPEVTSTAITAASSNASSSSSNVENHKKHSLEATTNSTFSQVINCPGQAVYNCTLEMAAAGCNISESEENQRSQINQMKVGRVPLEPDSAASLSNRYNKESIEVNH